MKFIEVIPVPIFQEFKCFGTETLDGTSCLGRSVGGSVVKLLKEDGEVYVWGNGVHDGPSSL